MDLVKGVDNHRFTFDAVFTEADSNATVRPRPDLAQISPRSRPDLASSPASPLPSPPHKPAFPYQVHATLLRPLLQHVLGGGLATVFAFGQTGSGP